MNAEDYASANNRAYYCIFHAMRAVIALDGETLVFVEVKTRKSNIQAPPQDNVDMGKQMRTARAAKGYLRKTRDRRLRNMECIFDVVAVTFSEDGVHAEFIEQAFIPLYI